MKMSHALRYKGAWYIQRTKFKKINPKFPLSTIFQRQEATEFSERDTELEIYKYELNASSSSQFVI